MIPIDPKEKKRQEEEQRMHRAALVPMVVAMLLVAAVAGYVFWGEMTRQPDPPRARETMTRYESQAFDDRMDLLEDPMSYQGDLRVDDLFGQHITDSSMNREPADLAPFPEAERITGIEREGSEFVEQISIWRVRNASLSDVHEHYQRSAKARGFTPLGNRSERMAARTGDAIHEVFWAPSDDDDRQQQQPRSFGRILTLRINPASDGSLRVLLDLTRSQPG